MLAARTLILVSIASLGLAATEASAGSLFNFPLSLPGAPPAPDGVWLIRPDGYVAATAPGADLSSISDVLRRMSA